MNWNKASVILGILVMLSIGTAHAAGFATRCPTPEFVVRADYGSTLFGVRFQGETQAVRVEYGITDALALNAEISGPITGGDWKQLPRVRFVITGRLLDVDHGRLAVEGHAGIHNLNQFDSALRMGLNMPTGVGVVSFLAETGLSFERGFQLIQDAGAQPGSIQVEDVVQTRDAYMGFAGRIDLQAIPLMVSSRVDFYGLNIKPYAVFDVTGAVAQNVYLGAAVWNILGSRSQSPQRVISLYYTF